MLSLHKKYQQNRMVLYFCLHILIFDIINGSLLLELTVFGPKMIFVSLRPFLFLVAVLNISSGQHCEYSPMPFYFTVPNVHKIFTFQDIHKVLIAFCNGRILMEKSFLSIGYSLTHDVVYESVVNGVSW